MKIDYMSYIDDRYIQEYMEYSTTGKVKKKSIVRFLIPIAAVITATIVLVTVKIVPLSHDRTKQETTHIENFTESINYNGHLYRYSGETETVSDNYVLNKDDIYVSEDNESIIFTYDESLQKYLKYEITD